MLSDQLLEMARRRIAMDLRDRQVAHRHEIGKLRSGFAARGALNSGFAQTALDDAIGQEYVIRALLVWQVISRVLAGVDLAASPGLGAQLKCVVAEYLQTTCDDLEQSHAAVVGLMTGAGSMKTNDAWRDRAYQRAASEIDLSLLSASRAASVGASVVNIYQPYGIVQTGAGASATFTQLFGPAEQAKIQAALDAAGAALESAKAPHRPDIPAVLEVVADAKAEVARERPNIARLGGALMAIAQTIQTMGSGSQAYQLLKAAAALIGVTLP